MFFVTKIVDKLLEGEPEGKWMLRLTRYTSSSQWNYFLNNPQGGGGGGNLSHRMSLKATIQGVMNNVSTTYMPLGTPYTVQVEIGDRPPKEYQVVRGEEDKFS